MSCFVQYAPYHLRESDWDTERENLGDTVQATLESFFPGFGDLVLQREVRTPLDIERTVGLSEGNIFAGEFLAPQMYFFRPAPGWSQYRTPIDGYYQCGSGTHPGGCVMGAPGQAGRAADPQGPRASLTRRAVHRARPRRLRRRRSPPHAWVPRGLQRPFRGALITRREPLDLPADRFLLLDAMRPVECRIRGTTRSSRLAPSGDRKIRTRRRVLRREDGSTREPESGTG